MKAILQKKILLITLILLLIGSSTVFAAQKSNAVKLYFAPIHFNFDGTELAPPADQKAFIYNGHTYVPLRFISYAFHYAVKWDGNTYTVTVTTPQLADQVQIREYNLNHEIRNPVKPSKVDPSQLNGKNADVFFTTIHYVFKGVDKTPSSDLPGFIYNNRIFVPMRFFSDSMQMKINWDPNTYSISTTAQDKQTTNQQGTTAATSPTKESYDSILNKTDQQVLALKNEAEDYFNQLITQYTATTDSKKKSDIISQGYAALSQYDQKFNQVMDNLRTELTANGYSTDIIQKYNDAYAKQKQDAIATVLTQLAG